MQLFNFVLMMYFNYIPAFILLTGGAITSSINNDYTQYGFLGILLGILIWYSKKQYSEGVRRDKLAETEKKEMISRYEAIIKDKDAHHERELENERNRYYEMHKELMVLIKSNIKIGTHE